MPPMSRLLPVAAILVATLTPSLFTIAAQESYLALTHVAVVDVTAGRAIPDQTVLIRGNRIAAVGTTVQVPAAARQVNLSGKFIVPGFFDMHAHAALAITRGDEQSRRRTIETELLRRVREGVLGIRDMGAPFEALNELRRVALPQDPLRPRVWLTGPPLTGPGGDPDFQWLVDTPAEARQAVERLAVNRVDFIKVHDWLRPEVYAEVMSAARAKSLRVVGHIPVALTVEAVVDSGQRDIEHIGSTTHGILRSCSNAQVALPDTLRPAFGQEVAAHASAMSQAYLGPLVDGFDPERCRVLIRRLAREKVWQVPTLSFWQSIVENPPAQWNGPIDRLFTILLRIVGMMSQEGVPIMTGLDRARGKTIADEIELLVRAGLSPAKAVHAAATAPAEYLGVADSLGGVAAGKFADVVILNGNPLDDVRAVRRIHGVLANGRLLIEERPPVIDMHQHSAQLTPKAYAQMGASNLRYVFLSSTTADLKAWAAEADPKRYLPALVFPCEAGRAPGPGAGRQCLDDASEFPDVTWLRQQIRAGRIKALGELAPQYMGISPADSRLEPYWQLAEEFDIPVGIHLGPGPPAAAYDSSPAPIKYGAFRMTAGDPLLLEEVLLRHKRLRVFIMHAGWPLLDSMVALLYGHPNVYVDVAALENPTIVPREGYLRYLRALVESGFGKRIMFGSEFTNLFGAGVDAILAADFLSVDQKADILCNNAARFLRLDNAVCLP
jgi:imidazolonepropionase-like amidohydrolase